MGWQVSNSGKGRVLVIRALLRSGALLEHLDERQWTALMCASFHGHTSAVRGLLQLGADMHRMAGRHDSTALHAAAREGHGAVVRLLLAVILRYASCCVLKCPCGVGRMHAEHCQQVWQDCEGSSGGRPACFGRSYIRRARSMPPEAIHSRQKCPARSCTRLGHVYTAHRRVRPMQHPQRE